MAVTDYAIQFNLNARVLVFVQFTFCSDVH